MTLHIQLLGPPKISLDADPIDVPGRRPQALLAYLLVTGVAHSRQHLVDLLFEGPDDPRAALRWTLAKLRGAIGADYILADRQAVTFNFESDHWLDLAAFEAGQIDLYRGDFLEGLHVRDAYRFEDWTFFERERLRGSYQEALTVRLGEYEERGDASAVVETAHQLLRLDNLREDWYRALMWSYAPTREYNAVENLRMVYISKCGPDSKGGSHNGVVQKQVVMWDEERARTFIEKRAWALDQAMKGELVPHKTKKKWECSYCLVVQQCEAIRH